VSRQDSSYITIINGNYLYDIIGITSDGFGVRERLDLESSSSSTLNHLITGPLDHSITESLNHSIIDD
jgi:hypothetical protein